LRQADVKSLTIFKNLYDNKTDLSISFPSFDEFEEALLLSDAGVETTTFLVNALKERWKRGQIKTSDDIKQCLIEETEALLHSSLAYTGIYLHPGDSVQKNVAEQVLRLPIMREELWI